MILFRGYDKFLNVVTTRLTDGGTAGSLEGLHGGYHNYLGEGGQTSDPAAAAFDPVSGFTTGKSVKPLRGNLC
jgi:hypothetical protein